MAKKTNGHGTVAPPAPTKELAVIEEKDVGVMPAALAGQQMSAGVAAFLEDAKGRRPEPAKVPIITIDHKEGQFVLPSGELVSEVAGYPVYYFQTRRFYKKPPIGGQKGSPPDCWSADLLVPHLDSLEKQAETCADCPMNQWGTGRDGKSKSCATQTWLFLLNPEFGKPPIGVIVAPPSSIRPLLGTKFSSGYLSKCAARHGVYEVVWSTFRLQQMGDAVTYCVLDPIMGPSAGDNEEECRRIAAVRNQFISIMEQMRGMTAVVGAATEE